MKNNQLEQIAIVGCGKVGRVLIKAFIHAGYRISGIVVRKITDQIDESIQLFDSISQLSEATDFVLLTVRDNQIKGLVDEIVSMGGFHRGTVIAHAAGYLSASILEPVRKVGALPLAWHPMQTFVGGEEPEILEGVTFGIDGDPEAVEIGEGLAIELGGIPVIIPAGKREIYHLAAVMACNMTSGLGGMAIKLLNDAGFTDEQALRAIGALMMRTAQNLNDIGLPDAISGPLRRGDIEAVRSHLEILEEYTEIRRVYISLSEELLDMLDDNEISAILKPLLK